MKANLHSEARRDATSSNSAPLRVLMTADTVGGVWTYAVELCRALNGRADILLAAMGGRCNESQRRQARDAGVRLCESDYRLEWMNDPWDDLQEAGDWLLGLADFFDPDIVHLNHYAHGHLPWERPVLTVGHSCVYSWWDAVHGGAPPRTWRRYRRTVRRGLQHSTFVTAPTQAMLDQLKRFYGPFRAVQAVHNGIDPRLFAPGFKEPFVLTVGRLWDRAKNTDLVCAAAPKIPWPVYCIGSADGTADPPSFEGVRRLRPLNRDEVADWMARASIYAAPALYEPFGLAILEAALSGCALVLGDIPTLREVWQDNALYVDPRDDAALAAAIKRLTENADLRRTYARRAFTHAKTYTADAMADAHLRLYRAMNWAEEKHGESAIRKEFHETRAFLPLTDIRLEPRERALSTRNGA